ncbi:hypothetical protein TNCV_2863031 [Trichonephila clavipes]|nr:hypothetical protein TNCV_2863031 [Trichonephila clavipes]
MFPGGSNHTAKRLFKASHTFSMEFILRKNAVQSIRVISSLSSSCRISAVRCGCALSSIKAKSRPIAPQKRRICGRISSLQKRSPLTEPLSKT